MAQTTRDNPTSPEALELGYEPQRVPVRGILLFIMLFAIALAAIQALVWWIMRVYEKQNDYLDAPASAVRHEGPPPAPNLQPSLGHNSQPREDLESLRRQEDAIFDGLGWNVNAATHEVKIPPALVSRLAADEQSRARQQVPPTTTGKPTNSISPGRPAVPSGQASPGENP